MKRTRFPVNRKSQKGKRFTADFIPYETAQAKGNELLRSDKQAVIGFYILFSINSGLRVSDVLKIRHRDLIGLRPGEYLNLNEQKTGKFREIQVNSKITEAYKYLTERLQVEPDQSVFLSNKQTVYRTESLNTILKKVFIEEKVPHISTHSLRKSFGRHVYELNGNSEDALIKLSELFQHSSMAITRKYLGLRREELGSIYMNL